MHDKNYNEEKKLEELRKTSKDESHTGCVKKKKKKKNASKIKMCIFQVFFEVFSFKLLNIINFSIFNYINIISYIRKRTSLTTLNFNMFFKKETDVENIVLEKN